MSTRPQRLAPAAKLPTGEVAPKPSSSVESAQVKVGIFEAAAAIADVGAGGVERRVAPRVDAALAALGRELPLFFSGQPSADPLAEGLRLLPIDAVDRMIEAAVLQVAAVLRVVGGEVLAGAGGDAPLVGRDRHVGLAQPERADRDLAPWLLVVVAQAVLRLAAEVEGAAGDVHELEPALGVDAAVHFVGQRAAHHRRRSARAGERAEERQESGGDDANLPAHERPLC